MRTWNDIEARYTAIIADCREIFRTKGNAYGPTWSAFRWVSLCDQLWIKIKRVRQLEERESLIPESAEGEYMALINYAVIFLMRLENPALSAHSASLAEDIERVGALGEDALLADYDTAARAALDLCRRKNHDYGDAWQEMDIRAITDMVVIKILRMRHILAAKAEIEARDVDEQLLDIINYSVFALILMADCG